MLTYGDGVTDLNIADTIAVHELSGAILSLTAYKPGGKFGALQIDLDTDQVLSFQENRMVTVIGLMPVILSVNLKCSIIFRNMTILLFLSVLLWNVLPVMVKCMLTVIKGSGNLWIRFVIIWS